MKYLYWEANLILPNGSYNLQTVQSADHDNYDVLGSNDTEGTVNGLENNDGAGSTCTPFLIFSAV